MVRAKRGQEFERAFESLYPRACQVARRLLCDPIDAEDAAAEALARTLVHWGRVRSLDNIEAWVSRVTINTAFDMLRSERRRRQLAPATRPATDDPWDGVAANVALVDGLKALSPRQREVVLLRYVGDMSAKQVAASLGIGVESVKEHAARALVSLRGTGMSQLSEVEDALA
jgi:RNA polymerase sigma factor (sigma-70 family)